MFWDFKIKCKYLGRLDKNRKSILKLKNMFIKQTV